MKTYRHTAATIITTKTQRATTAAAMMAAGAGAVALALAVDGNGNNQKTPSSLKIGMQCIFLASTDTSVYSYEKWQRTHQTSQRTNERIKWE